MGRDRDQQFCRTAVSRHVARRGVASENDKLDPFLSYPFVMPGQSWKSIGEKQGNQCALVFEH